MTLDVDEKIMDRNLKIVGNEVEEEFDTLFPGMAVAKEPVSLLPEPNYPSVQVIFCHIHLIRVYHFSLNMYTVFSLV